MLTRMLQRRGTTAQWNDVKSTLILAAGEVGFVTDGADKDKFKIGDGSTTWENLEFYLRDDQNSDIYAKLIATQTFEGSQVFTPSTSIVVPLVVSGAVSQSADLQRWRDSSNNTLASVDATGKLTAVGGLFNSTVNVNANKITNVAAPTDSGDATNKQYVDDAIAGLAWKAPVNLVSASGLNTFINVPLTGNTETVTLDGHSTLTSAKSGYRLLLVAQTTSSENGIYTYTDNGTTYTLTRSDDATPYTELKGASVFIEEGTNYGTSSWVQTNHYITSFSGQNWVQFNGASQITAGSGLTKTGNTINAIGTTDRITANADSIDIASTYVGQTSITTLGTVSSGTWEGTKVDAAHGGTGLTSYTVGDLVYANGTTQLTQLSAGTANYTLLSGGAGTAPSWGQIVTASLANASSSLDGVTYAKMQFVSGQYKLLGRISAGSGVVEELSADNLITMLNTASSGKIDTARLNTLTGGNYGTSTSVAKADHTHALDDLSDVVLGGKALADRQILKYNGSNWINDVPSGGISISNYAPGSSQNPTPAPSAGDAWFDSTDGSLYIYYDDSTTRPAGTNLVANPSFETNVTGWTGTSATVAQSSAQYYIGTKSALVTPSANTGGISFTATTVSGTTYRFSAYVYTATNKTLQLAITSPATLGTSTPVTYNSWTRLDVSFVANATSTVININSVSSTDPFYVDAVMLEASATLNDYFDGSSYNSSWTGTAHASTSTTAGGQTKQWVQVRANSALEATILTRMSAVESRATNLEAANPVVVANQAGRSAVYPSPVQGNTVWRSDLGYMERYYTAYDAVTNPSGTTGTVGWYEYRGGAPLSPNAFINGGLDIWQRGTSFAAAGYTADRWNVVTASGQTIAVSQQTFTPGAAPVSGYENTYFLRSTWSGTPTGYFWLNQKIEDVRMFAGQTVTVSFWAKAGTATTAFSTMIEQNFGSGGSTAAQVSGSAISLTTSWQRFSTTLNVPSISGKTIGTSSYLDVRPLYSGSSVNGNAIDIFGLQIEVGPVATPFRRNQPNTQAELAACQRYYFRKTSGATYSLFFNGHFATTTIGQMFVQFPVPMRRIPDTAVEWTGTIGDYSILNAGVAALTTPGPALASDSLTTLGGRLDINVTGATAGQGCIFRGSNNTNAYLGFNAEL